MSPQLVHPHLFSPGVLGPLPFSIKYSPQSCDRHGPFPEATANRGQPDINGPLTISAGPQGAEMGFPWFVIKRFSKNKYQASSSKPVRFQPVCLEDATFACCWGKWDFSFLKRQNSNQEGRKQNLHLIPSHYFSFSLHFISRHRHLSHLDKTNSKTPCGIQVQVAPLMEPSIGVNAEEQGLAPGAP